jgi:hypothetical protein
MLNPQAIVIAAADDEPVAAKPRAPATLVVRAAPRVTLVPVEPAPAAREWTAHEIALATNWVAG